MSEKWYFKPHILVIAFLCMGPFMLPLVWLNPGLSRKNKRVMTVIILVLTLLLGIIFFSSVKSIVKYYSFMLESMQ